MIEVLADWAGVVRDVASAPHGLEALALVMRYILQVSDHAPPEALQAFLDRAVGLEAKDIVMTVGEQLIQQGVQQGIQQGVQQGIQQGVQQGIQQGVQQGERAVLLRLLRQRFGAEIGIEIERRLATAASEQIATWIGRVLSAATLGELLTD
jgi:hypothetical protein